MSVDRDCQGKLAPLRVCILQSSVQLLFAVAQVREGTLAGSELRHKCHAPASIARPQPASLLLPSLGDRHVPPLDCSVPSIRKFRIDLTPFPDDLIDSNDFTASRTCFRNSAMRRRCSKARREGKVRAPAPSSMASRLTASDTALRGIYYLARRSTLLTSPSLTAVDHSVIEICPAPLPWEAEAPHLYHPIQDEA
jgi:hypothetical protein